MIKNIFILFANDLINSMQAMIHLVVQPIVSLVTQALSLTFLEVAKVNLTYIPFIFFVIAQGSTLPMV